MLRNKNAIKIFCFLIILGVFSSIAFAINEQKDSIPTLEDYLNSIDTNTENTNNNYYNIDEYNNDYQDYDNDNYDYDYNDYNDYDYYDYDYYDYDNYDYENYDYEDDYEDVNSYEDIDSNNYDYDYDYDYDNYEVYDENNYDWSNYNYSSYYDSNDFSFYDGDSSFTYNDFYNNEGYAKEEHIPGEKFLKTPTTIQYTFDIGDKYPKYTDTGAFATKEDLVGINELKEFLKQISVIKNAKYIEDNDKVMALIDEELIVLDSNKVTGEMLEKIFEDTLIKVKIQPTRAGGKYNLADYLESNGEIPIRVNGEKIKLITAPIIDNSKVLFPIRSIGEALGAEVSWDNKKSEAVIEKDDKIIIFKENSDIVTINEKEYLITNKANLNHEERRLLSVIKIITNELGATMEWDAKDLVLDINTPQEEVDLDADF